MKTKPKRRTDNRRFVRITSNFRGKDARTEHLAGREYLVVPCVIIVEGVLNGSQGPGLYRERDIVPTVDDWNGMPVHKNHPKGRSARTPKMRNKTYIGDVYNAEWTGNKLTCEVWLDVERTEKVDGRILAAVRNKQKIEVSTGLYLNRYRKEGVFHGERYSWIAKNQKPDHLAVLLDSAGACSIEKGCGLLANSRRGKKKCQCDKTPTKEIKNMLSPKRRLRMVRQLTRNSGQWDESDKKMLLALNDKMLKKIYNAALEPDDEGNDVLDRKKAVKKKIKVSAKNKTRVERDRPAKKVKNGKSGLPFDPKEFWKFAPKEWQAAVKNTTKVVRRRKEALIEVILNNDNNVFSEKWLNKQEDIDLLEGIAALAGGASEEESEMFAGGFAPDYSGAAGVIAKNKGRRRDEDDEEDDDPLEPAELFAENESEDDEEESSKKKSKKRA